MERFLVAFERPQSDITTLAVEEAWDRWVSALQARGLQLVVDLDPVATPDPFEIYEAVSA